MEKSGIEARSMMIPSVEEGVNFRYFKHFKFSTIDGAVTQTVIMLKRLQNIYFLNLYFALQHLNRIKRKILDTFHINLRFLRVWNHTAPSICDYRNLVILLCTKLMSCLINMSLITSLYFLIIEY